MKTLLSGWKQATEWNQIVSPDNTALSTNKVIQKNFVTYMTFQLYITIFDYVQNKINIDSTKHRDTRLYNPLHINHTGIMEKDYIDMLDFIKKIQMTYHDKRRTVALYHKTELMVEKLYTSPLSRLIYYEYKFLNRHRLIKLEEPQDQKDSDNQYYILCFLTFFRVS